MGNVELLNANKYFSYFPINKNEDVSDNDYVWSVTDEEYDQFSSLSGDDYVVDIDEFSLLSYYSKAILNIRPVQAAEELPADDPKLSGKKLGAMLFQNLQVLRFLGDTAAVGRYEAMLNHVMTKNGVTRTEVENFYRNGIRDLISEVVTEEFNKISFNLNNYSHNSKFSYDAVLTKTTQNHYILNYGRPSVENDDKTLTAQTLQDLSSAMRASVDFVPAAIDEVEAQADLIPANVYAEWQRKGIARGVDGLQLIIDTLTDFYLNPNQATYDNVMGITANYCFMVSRTEEPFYRAVQNSFSRTTSALSVEFDNRLAQDLRGANLAALVRKVNNPQLLSILSTEYATGGD